MNKKKLIELRCKAWGITETEYYCNQCSDFSLEDMARAYRRGKNKGRAELEKENAELKARLNAINLLTPELQKLSKAKTQQLSKAKEIINDCVCELQNILFYKMRNKERIASTLDKAEQFLSEVEK